MLNDANHSYHYYYGKWHVPGAEHARDMIRQYSAFLKPHIPPAKDGRILEIGCGMGFAMEALREMGFANVEGVDVNAQQVEACKQKKLNAHLVGDTSKFLEERPGAYDLILGFDVIEHMPREQQMLIVKAVHKALAPGGKFVCRVPNANSAVFGRWLYNDLTHHTGFTELSLDFLMHIGGFQDTRILNPEKTKPFPAHHFLSGKVLKRGFWKQVIQRLIFRSTRFFRRLQMIAEFGWDEGSSVILALNLLGVAVKSK